MGQAGGAIPGREGERRRYARDARSWKFNQRCAGGFRFPWVSNYLYPICCMSTSLLNLIYIRKENGPALGAKIDRCV